MAKKNLTGNIKATEEWINKLDLSDKLLKEFLRTWDGTGEIQEAFTAYMKESANSMTLFQRVSTAAGETIKESLVLPLVVWLLCGL